MGNTYQEEVFYKLDISRMLLVAKRQLAYSEYIARFPRTNQKHDFDLISATDKFYRNVSSLCCHDAILLISSLMENVDKRVKSFFNWPNFLNAKHIKLKNLRLEFEKNGLKEVRDQIIAHQDIKNINNNFIEARMCGVNIDFLIIVKKFLNKLIKEFSDYTKNDPMYNNNYFDTSDIQQEIEAIMKIAKPTLTNFNV